MNDNALGHSDLVPLYCWSSPMFWGTQDVFSAIKTAASLGSTNKSFYSLISSDCFWHRLVTRIGADALFLDDLPQTESNWLALLKRQFYDLTQWTRNMPFIESEIFPAFALWCQPLKYKSEIEMIAFQNPIITYSMSNIDSRRELILPESEVFCPPSCQKPYMCSTRSDNFFVLDVGDSQVFIYDGKDRKFLSKFTFDGVILQTEIRDDCLYIRGKDNETQSLVILNLTSLNEKPKKIAMPVAASDLIYDYQDRFCFGKTSLMGFIRDGELYKLITASYEDLKKYPNDTDTFFPWIEESFSNYPRLFEHGNNFVAVTIECETKAVSITEICVSKEIIFTQSLAKDILILDPKEKFHCFDTFSYINGRLLVAYNENQMNKISSYDVESKKLSLVVSEKATSVMGLGPFPAKFFCITALKISYLKLSMTPPENGHCRLQHSITSINYGTRTN